MGKYDKDRFQKELALRYCLARGSMPFLEVIVPSSSDLSDTVEVLTDIDVLGVDYNGDGGLYRTIFDCKTGKMSPINRAFWAAGLRDYTQSDEAVVILKSRAVHNHRISALTIDVDLHDEKSFESLGQTFDQRFSADIRYQSSIDRWNALYDVWSKEKWTAPIFDLARNQVPLSRQPWTTFRRLVAEIRDVRGSFDPSKKGHVALYLDTMASAFVLWSAIGRDVRRFYDPAMDRKAFEVIFRYYIWGGRESYLAKQQLRPADDVGHRPPLEMPAWPKLVDFAGLVVAAPQEIFSCATVCRDLALRTACGIDPGFDAELKNNIASSKRINQYIVGLSDYLISAATLPKDLGKEVNSILFSV